MSGDYIDGTQLEGRSFEGQVNAIQKAIYGSGGIAEEYIGVSNLTALYKLYTNAQDEEKVMAENALLTGVKKAASYVRGSKIEELLSALKKDGATELAEKVTEIEKDVYQKAMEYLLSLRKFSSQKGFPKPPKGLPKSEPKRKITV